MKKVKIALLGLGNVGRGVWNILCENKDQIIKRSGYEVEVAKILVRDKSIHTTFPRLKLRSETGNSECQKIFDRELSKAYGIAMLELIGCTCAIEAPPIACLCYVAVMARYYSTIDTLEREKQECELRNN